MEGDDHPDDKEILLKGSTVVITKTGPRQAMANKDSAAFVSE